MRIEWIPLMICATLAVCIPITTPAISANSPTRTHEAEQEPIKIVSTYKIDDLPLWTADGKDFEPTLLIDFVKLSLAQGIEPGEEGPSVSFYKDTKSLIVTGTRAEHKQVLGILEKLRAD